MKKILSLILAVSLVASLLVVSVSAAGANTVTIAADKTEALAAGDKVTVTVTLDSTADLTAFEYDLLFDADVFEVDKTEGWRSMEDFLMHENFIDQTWYDGVKAQPFGKIMTFSIGTTDGKVSFAAASGNPIPGAVAATNYLVGKYYLTVKADAPDGETTLSLSDASNTNKVAVNCEPITLTVGDGASEPEGPTVGAAADYTGNAVADGKVAGITIKETDKKYDNCYAVSATIENAVGQIGVLFVPQDVNDWGKAADAVYGANLGGGTVTINAALRGIPTSLAGRDIVMLSKAYALVDGNYTYGAELTTTVNFDVTAE